ncbi:MAG: ABC transporter permease, partial [Microcoleus sp.]
MDKAFYTVRTFAIINTRRFFRDRLAIFFTILFPLIFLFVFGGIFGGSNGANFHIALINQSKSGFATDFSTKLKSNKTFNIDKDATTLPKARELMSRGQLDATIVLPDTFGTVKPGQSFPSGQLQINYTQNNQSAGTTLSSIMQGILKNVNKGITNAPEPFTVSSTQLQQKSLTPFDYTFSGLLGFSIIGLGIFGPVNVFPELKKQGILRRLSTTPLRIWQYFSAVAISQTIVGLVSISVMFIVAMTVFHLTLVGNLLELIIVIMMGIITILGIGLAIGGWASNERQAAPLSNIIVFPMMFLSGTFFPRFLMPDWLQQVSSFLPLTPIIDSIRLIATEGKHLADIGLQLGVIGIWFVVIYFIAFRVFRWE